MNDCSNIRICDICKKLKVINNEATLHDNSMILVCDDCIRENKLLFKDVSNINLKTVCTSTLNELDIRRHDGEIICDDSISRPVTSLLSKQISKIKRRFLS